MQTVAVSSVQGHMALPACAIVGILAVSAPALNRFLNACCGVPPPTMVDLHKQPLVGIPMFGSNPGTQCAQGSLYALCLVPCALCLVPCVLCLVPSVPCALCLVPCTLCQCALCLVPVRLVPCASAPCALCPVCPRLTLSLVRFPPGPAILEAQCQVLHAVPLSAQFALAYSSVCQGPLIYA